MSRNAFLSFSPRSNAPATRGDVEKATCIPGWLLFITTSGRLSPFHLMLSSGLDVWISGEHLSLLNLSISLHDFDLG